MPSDTETPPKTDQQKADEYRQRMTDAGTSLVAIMAEAVADGFSVALDIEGNPPTLNGVKITKNVEF